MLSAARMASMQLNRMSLDIGYPQTGLPALEACSVGNEPHSVTDVTVRDPG
jgi:hypothetical protein